MSADFTPTQQTIKDLRPFRFWCQKVLPTVYDDSLSYYELLTKLVNYINETVDNIDILNSNVENLYDAYVLLQDYVNNFVDSEVETLVSEKLDQMAEDGTLTALIGAYIDPYFEEVESDIFYESVEYRKYRVHSTDAYVCEIPLTDVGGETIIPYMHMDTELTPAEYARNAGTTFTCNGTLNLLKTDGESWQVPSVISRGQVIYQSDFTGTPKANNAKYLSINEDRTFKEYEIHTNTADMLADGAYNVFTTYYPLVTNGSLFDLTNVTANEDGRVTEDNPQLALGIKNDKTIVVWACDGRTDINPGMTSTEVAQEMLTLGCQNAWMLDGGGSTSFNWQMCKMNRNIDDRGTTDRMIRFTFNIKKDISNEVKEPLYAKIGQQKQDTIQQIIPYVNDLYSKTGYVVPGVNVLTEGTDLRTITKVGRYNASSSVATTLVNCPTKTGFAMTVEYIHSTLYLYTIRDAYGYEYRCTNNYYSGVNHFTDWTKSASLTATMQIPPNTDLNDIVNSGVYYTANNNDTATLSNCPTSVLFLMEILDMTENVKIARITDYDAKVYVRRIHLYSDQTIDYTNWYEVSSSAVTQ